MATRPSEEPRPPRGPPVEEPDNGSQHDGVMGRAPWMTPGRLAQLVAVVLAAYVALNIVIALRGILVMLLVSLFLAFAMEPAVQWLGRHGWSRGLATAAVFVLLLLVGAGLLAAFVPLAVTQSRELIASIPRSADELAERLPFLDSLQTSPRFTADLQELSDGFSDRARQLAFGAAGSVVSIGATAVGALFQLLTILLVTFYLVADGPRARAVLARPLPKDRQRELLVIWEIAVQKTGGYIYSRLLLAVAAAVSTAVFLFVLGVPSPIPLGLLVGVVGVFVPVVGTYIGGIALLLVAFVDAPYKALWVLGFIVVYQQVENYLIAPRVQAHTMDVHPAVAFVSVLVGGTLLGAIGALLALPATGIIQALLSTYVRRHELIAELDEVELPGDPAHSTSSSTRRRRRNPQPQGASR